MTTNVNTFLRAPVPSVDSRIWGYVYNGYEGRVVSYAGGINEEPLPGQQMAILKVRLGEVVPADILAEIQAVEITEAEVTALMDSAKFMPASAWPE